MNQPEKKEVSKPEPESTACLPSCIHRNTPMCMQCTNWSEYEWDYTENNG
jgi:hypothetical protein